MRRRTAILLFVLQTLLGFGAGAGLYAQTGAEPEEGIIRIDIQGVATRTFFVRFSGDTLFLPFLQLSDFLRIPVDLDAELSEGNGEMPVGVPFHLSRSKRFASYAGDSLPAEPPTFHTIDGEIYIEQEWLAKWLQLSMRFDIAELRLVIGANDKIPRVQLARNRRRYAALGYADERLSERLEGEIERQIAGSLTLDWTAMTSHRKSSNMYAGTFNAGAPLLGGILNMRGGGAYWRGPTVETLFEIDSWNWQYHMPHFGPLRRLSVGSQPWGLERQYTLDLSNVPLGLRSMYGTHELAGTTTPGWTVELYDGDRLVDVTDADSTGRYSFQIPVGYGTLDRTLVAIGKYGEQLSERRRIQLGAELVVPGELEYDLHIAATRKAEESPVEATGFIRYGVSNGITVGVEGLLRSSSIDRVTVDSAMPSVYAQFWLGEAGDLGLHYTPSHGLARADLFWTNPSSATLRLTVDSLSLTRGSFISSAMGSMQIGPLVCGATGRYAATGSSRVMQISPWISGYVGGISFNASTTVKRTTHDLDAAPVTPVELPSTTSALTSLRITTSLMRGVLFSVRGSYDYEHRALGPLNFSTNVSLLRNVGLSLTYNLDLTDSRYSGLYAKLKLDLSSGARVTLSGDYQDGSFTTGSYVQGAAVVSEEGVQMFRNHRVGQSMILVRAFRDDNGNGGRDDGEPDLEPPGAQLGFGTNQLQDNHGMFTAIPSHTDCLLQVDRWSFADQEIYPRTALIPVYTLPSFVHVIDVAFAPGFDVTGQCEVRAVGTEERMRTSATNGLRVSLRPMKGDGEYEGEIFSDGSILISGVAEGEYSIVLDAQQLASRRLQARAVPEHVTLSASAPKLPTIVLEPSSASRTPATK